MSIELYIIATVLIFIVSFIFAMLGLGGGMLYVPIFKWLELPLKTTAIPLGLLLNGLNTLLAFIAYARQGLVDFRGGLPAALAALIFAPIGAWSVQFVPSQWLLTRVRDNKFIQFNGLKSVFILKIAKFDLNANFKFITH
jgi:uncharacterized protein